MTRLERVRHQRPRVSNTFARSLVFHVTGKPGRRRQGADSTMMTENFERRAANGEASQANGIGQPVKPRCTIPARPMAAHRRTAVDGSCSMACSVLFEGGR